MSHISRLLKTMLSDDFLLTVSYYLCCLLATTRTLYTHTSIRNEVMWKNVLYRIFHTYIFLIYCLNDLNVSRESVITPGCDKMYTSLIWWWREYIYIYIWLSYQARICSCSQPVMYNDCWVSCSLKYGTADVI